MDSPSEPSDIELDSTPIQNDKQPLYLNTTRTNASEKLCMKLQKIFEKDFPAEETVKHKNLPAFFHLIEHKDCDQKKEVKQKLPQSLQ